MFCGKCGFRLPDNQIQCPRCGYIVSEAVLASGSEMPSEADMPSELVLPPDLAPAKASPQKHRALMIVAIALAVLVVGVVGFLIGSAIYRNSDGYKIAQTEEAVLEGNPDEGLEYIRGVNSPEADAVRQFCEIEKQRKSFFDNYDKNTLQGFDAPVKVSYDKLSMAYNSFNASDKLPGKLKERYDSYNGRVTAMNSVLSDLTTRTLTDSQRGVLAFGERKRGANFTVNELSTVVSQSEPAVLALQSVVVNNSRYAAFAQNNDAAVVNAMYEFYQVASDRLTQDRFDLENYEQRFGPNVAILLSDTDENYVASMGSMLRSLSNLSDAQSNAQKLYTAMCYAWAAYAYA